jgi:hypothetical protein
MPMNEAGAHQRSMLRWSGFATGRWIRAMTFQISVFKILFRDNNTVIL